MVVEVRGEHVKYPTREQALWASGSGVQKLARRLRELGKMTAPALDASPVTWQCCCANGFGPGDMQEQKGIQGKQRVGDLMRE
jgi:hypothetical protein